MPPDQLKEFESGRREAIARELEHTGQFCRVHVFTRGQSHEINAADLVDLYRQLDDLWNNSPPVKSESAQADDLQGDILENLAQAKPDENT